MTELEFRYNQALAAIHDLFSVRSVPTPEVLDKLQALVDELNILISALEYDAKKDED